MEQPLPSDIRQAMSRMGLLADGHPVSAQPLAGGVSSDIWRVEQRGRVVCVKQALAQLKVAQRWEVSAERNAFEVAWFEVAGAIVPDAVPRILGHDSGAGVFVMEYLEPQAFPVWKSRLLEGGVDLDTAAAVGCKLAAIHSGTAGRSEIADRFDTDELFYSLRPEPYLLAAARKHPDLAPRLRALAGDLMQRKLALVHGDVSPKNILVGERGPVFIDAECAWYGDPAFDLAFCLNHLLLKCLWRPSALGAYLRGFAVLAESYLEGVDWESRRAIEERVAELLPGLSLARVDGKSPVEYITEEPQREQVRVFARAALLNPPVSLAGLAAEWGEHLKE